jgi:IS6 family transposase
MGCPTGKLRSCWPSAASPRWTYLYRAIDQHGQVIEVLLSARRDLAAARRFFGRALRAGTVPAEVITDRPPAYPRVLDELVPSALHTVERYRATRSRQITGG